MSSRERGHAEVVLRALDDDLVRTDARHRVVNSLTALVELAFDLERGEFVRHHPQPPARPVGTRSAFAISDDLGRRLVFLALAKGTKAPFGWGRLGIALEVVWTLARSCAMITQRPMIGSFRSSGTVGLLGE